VALRFLEHPLWVEVRNLGTRWRAGVQQA
jgi:hypothetical protein